MGIKKPLDMNVFDAAQKRVSYAFDNFERVFVAFSGGKDSSVLLHLAMDEAMRRGRRIGAMYIDFEAQYRATIEHVEDMFSMYASHLDAHWICLPISLRNACSNFEPKWTCWDPERKSDWVRQLPEHEAVVSDSTFYPFFEPGMEFEEFIVPWGEWWGRGDSTAALIGIRCDESLNRFRTIASSKKATHQGNRWTTQISESLCNVYPIYDWRTRDIWIYNTKNKDKPHNRTYDLMHQAGVKPSQQRLCQPYGDDQRRGLWLYHILEPDTWFKLVSRVNGANSGALYASETGNSTGRNKISKPEGHSWKSFCNLLLATMPKPTREHYIERFRSFLDGWKGRGYTSGIPDKAPLVLEKKYWAPSWRRLCKVLLRNDWWCKGLGYTQPKSEAYGRYLKIRKSRQAQEEVPA